MTKNKSKESVKMTMTTEIHECVCGGFITDQCNQCDDAYPIELWREEQSQRELIEEAEKFLEEHPEYR